MIERVAILIITYRRPNTLRRLLRALEKQEADVQWRAIVVDNDPETTAREVVPQTDSRFQYVVEPEPGIPAARNRSLSMIVDTDDAVIFVDDDEVPHTSWLQTLVDYANETNAEVVAAAVIARLPATTPDWIVKGRFLQKRVRKTGERGGVPATNNTLVRTRTLRRTGVTFDSRFRWTGGSDTDFFLRLREAGVSWIWNAEAIVYEDIQTERLTLAWLLRRYVRGGEILTQLEPRPLRLFAVFAGRLALGVALTPIALFTPKYRRLALSSLGRAFGVARGLLGFTTAEYERDVQAT